MASYKVLTPKTRETITLGEISDVLKQSEDAAVKLLGEEFDTVTKDRKGELQPAKTLSKIWGGLKSAMTEKIDEALATAGCVAIDHEEREAKKNATAPKSENPEADKPAETPAADPSQATPETASSPDTSSPTGTQETPAETPKETAKEPKAAQG